MLFIDQTKQEMNRIEVIKGDITQIQVDAIVNAANSSLMGGGGVDGAIHRAGGKEILEECKKIITEQGTCPTGQAVLTTAGRLSAKYIIHTVGPIWKNGTQHEDENLKNCYINSLQLALKMDCKTVAFPSISTGVYGFPKDRAAKIAIKAISEFLAHNKTLEKVWLVCFDDENYRLIQHERDVQA